MFAACLHDISERKEAQARQRRFEAIVASSGEDNPLSQFDPSVITALLDGGQVAGRDVVH